MSLLLLERVYNPFRNAFSVCRYFETLWTGFQTPSLVKAPGFSKQQTKQASDKQP